MRARVLVCLVVVGFLIALPAVARPSDPSYPKQWGMFTIGAEDAWAKATGQGVIVAVVDTGVDIDHEDLSKKIVPGHDFFENDSDPRDENGHGTHVAGISAAITGNGRGVVGVAPDASIMSVRVLGDFGINFNPTNPTQLFINTANGVRWAVDHGAQVINMSFGSAAGSGPPTDISNAIKYAWSKGAICVVAAGNDSGESSGYTDQNAVIVAATDSGDQLAGYSNIVDKAKWGMSAPGSDVYSTYYDALVAPNNHSGYTNLSGTSMAAPHVAGAAALLRSMGLSPQQTVDRLLATAKDLGPKGRDSAYGAGRLDLAAAVSGPAGAASGGAAPVSGGGATAGSKSQEKASQKTGGSGAAQNASQNASPGSSLGDYKDPEPQTTAAGEKKKGLSSKTLLNIGIAVVLLGCALGWYLWFRRRAIPEE